MFHVHINIQGLFFIDGLGGTGKTFLYKALLAKIHSCGHTALAVTSSVYKITRPSGTTQLLHIAKIIIWDEASMPCSYSS